MIASVNLLPAVDLPFHIRSKQLSGGRNVHVRMLEQHDISNARARACATSNDCLCARVWPVGAAGGAGGNGVGVVVDWRKEADVEAEVSHARESHA